MHARPTGADHLAALTPLTIGVSHFKASLLGALWGFGHSVGQLLLGLCMVLLKVGRMMWMVKMHKHPRSTTPGPF